jgi:ATP-dependent RNA helicase SUPV3L1/SUV3
MRRLRENSVLNTEIGKTGEVIVEGHAIGRLDGFTFAPDAAEAGSDAKALQAAAQQVLASEIDARATKLSTAPDDQFVLTSDGTIRWTGDAVAKLVAADDALHPRLRIIADDRLSGAPREAVQTRLDLWLKTHIEKLLGPLFGLSKAEDITGIGRGIAFQLVEALGVLERSRISAEMKDLDQASRATLRKYGVRFGAYHIYFPALLKPAARALASLLWAEKQDNVDMSALSGAQHLASSGRTSFPVDKALHRDAYRVLGYRQCGERAVRVDILERLADLIRPALAWRESSPGEKPTGAFDGRGFVVTQAMTSLTGSAGEDFASILRALGYRMDKRPPLPPKPAPVEVVETVAAETPPVEASAETMVETPAETPAEEVAADLPVSGDPAPSASLLPSVTPIPVASEEPLAAIEAAVVETMPAEAAILDTPPEQQTLEAISAAEAVAEPATASEAPAESTAAEAVPAEAAASEAKSAEDKPETKSEAPAEAQLVEVWRPGGRSDERRPHHDRNRQRHHGRPAEGAQAASGEGGEGAPREQRHRRGRRNDFRKPREGVPADATAAPVAAEGAPAASEARQDRPPRERFEGKGRDGDRRDKFDRNKGDRNKGGDRSKGGGRDKGERGGRDFGGRDKGGRDKRDSGPSHRQWATSAAPRERDRPIDPNSPFAKLAALKEQLAGRKE